MSKHGANPDPTAEFLAGDYTAAVPPLRPEDPDRAAGSRDRLNEWATGEIRSPQQQRAATSGGPDSALARGWRRLSAFAQPATVRPADDECPDCGSDQWWQLGAVRVCDRCGQLRARS